jgi:hypothetical protein
VIGTISIEGMIVAEVLMSSSDLMKIIKIFVTRGVTTCMQENDVSLQVSKWLGLEIKKTV